MTSSICALVTRGRPMTSKSMSKPRPRPSANRPPDSRCMVVANVAVSSGCRVLWLVAAVAMPIRSPAAAAAPESAAASLVVKRSERKTEPRPSRSPRRPRPADRGAARMSGEPVEAQFGKIGVLHAWNLVWTAVHNQGAARRRRSARSSGPACGRSARPRPLVVRQCAEIVRSTIQISTCAVVGTSIAGSTVPARRSASSRSRTTSAKPASGRARTPRRPGRKRRPRPAHRGPGGAHGRPRSSAAWRARPRPARPRGRRATSRRPRGTAPRPPARPARSARLLSGKCR